MLKQLFSLLLIGLLPLVCAEPASAASKAEKEFQFAEKVKSSFQRLGVGEDARVAVKLRDKTKLTGYISDLRVPSCLLAGQS
ncbi:MAG: hypothetical protein HYR55_16095 [Acidobacteria bacterium]|nr:hypothetical protein [Acidobacteriota bacterium]MBI3656180.1 hypothetical protein [Acidobacteriota bacterium]